MSKKHEIKAIIYNKKGKVLSIGENSYVKTHPLQAAYAAKRGEPYKVFLHAEIDAIIKMKRMKGAHKISIFRFNEQGKPVSAKPCHICQHAIEVAGIKVVEHT